MKTDMRRVAIHFRRLGPYHIARIGAAAKVLGANGWEVIGLEVAATDVTYQWSQEREKTDWQRITIFPEGEVGRIGMHRLASGMRRELDRLRPDAVAVCGYSTADASAAIRWCRKQKATSILMSETRKADGYRVWWKEWLKSRLIRHFDAALCGGPEHRDYLINLGMDVRRIHEGYDVVDNQYFEQESESYRKESNYLGGPYFLSSNRFIPRKNLLMLLNAYHKYAKSAKSRTPGRCPWPLVLLGDGEQRAVLIERCKSLHLRICECSPWEPHDNDHGAAVYFPGFRQIAELPHFYAHAGCFIHPAIAEPWGLVVNEAMASSLPVLASTGTGAADKLVQDGITGWRFDANDETSLANLMATIFELSTEARRLVGKSARQTVEARCPLIAFGHGLLAALEYAGITGG